VPKNVYVVIGIDKNGGATKVAPASGYNASNDGLKTLLARKPTFTARTATRALPTTSPGPVLSGGAISGTVIGATAAVGLVVLAWCVVGRRVMRRRVARQTAAAAQGAEVDEYRHRQSRATTTQVSLFSGPPSELSPRSLQAGWIPVMQQQQLLQPPYGHQQYQHQHNHFYTSPPPPPPAELEVHGGPFPTGLGVVSDVQDGKKTGRGGRETTALLGVEHDHVLVSSSSHSKLGG
jgi:hypothetical protein